MLYPQISSIKTNKLIIKILMCASLYIAFLLLLINFLVNERLSWSLICIVGIVYVWITTLYSIYKKVNIAAHVMLQTICVSALTIAIDYIIGFRGWSLEIAVPIIITIANITLFVLTIVNRKRYIKYVIYELIIFIVSLIPMILFFVGIIKSFLLVTISTSIAVVNFLLTIILCGKDVKDEIKRRFHI